MDTAADPTKTTAHPHFGHEGHGVHLCSRCGWAFPNAHPSARHRRKHRRVCGAIEGYTMVADSTSASLGHSHSQHSAVSSFSDDENGSDGDSKAPSAKAVTSRSASQGGSGRVLERMNMSADDVFADAVSEFADANAGLAGDEGLSVNTETVPHKSFGAPDFAPPVVDVAVTGGIAQSSISLGNSNGSLQKGTTASLNQEQVMSLSEVTANIDDALTDASEEIKRSNAFEDRNGSETGFKKIFDASEVKPAPFIVPESKDANESSEAVTEEEGTSKDHAVGETEISQKEEKHDKSGSETFMDVHFQGGKTIVRSSDKFSGVKVEDIPQNQFDELSVELAAEGSTSASPVISKVVNVPSIADSDYIVLVNNQAVESISEIKEDISYSLSVDDTGALHSAAEIEALKTSLAHNGSGHVSDGSNEKYVNSLSGASANDDARAISTKGQKIVWNSNIIDPAGGYEGIVVEDLVAKGEGNVSEIETKSDNSSFNISSDEHVNMSHVLFVQSAGTASESLHADRAVHLSSDVNSSLGDEFIDNTTGLIKDIKEVKLDDAQASVPASDMNPVSHDVLLQKLEEDLPDDESFPATDTSSQNLGNNQVDDGGVICKDSCANDIGQSKGPEKGMAIPVVDAPNDISSPNGSSLDGNWGSVSVLSTKSDAAGDLKKTKEGQSDDKQDMFDPPSFLTLIDPQAQKAAATSSTSGEEVKIPEQPDAAKAAWFPSITNVPNDSHGRKKNEEIITKVTNWSTGKQHSPLKTLLGEAEANSPNSNPSATVPKDNKAVATVNSILGSEEPDHPKDKLNLSAKEWSPTARYPDAIKREKRKVKGRPYWVPFMCCSSVSSVK